MDGPFLSLRVSVPLCLIYPCEEKLEMNLIDHKRVKHPISRLVLKLLATIQAPC